MSVSQHSPSTNAGGDSTTVAWPRPERRRTPRGGALGEPSRPQLIALILGTYTEMPGLSLHLHQAVRLFGLRLATCQVVLDDLTRDGHLRQSPDGQYRAANGGGW